MKKLFGGDADSTRPFHKFISFLEVYYEYIIIVNWGNPNKIFEKYQSISK